MGVHYTSVIWDIIIQNPGRKLVALAIADMAGKEGTCYPSVRYVAEMCNMHPDTVRDHLRHLEAIGLLKREKQIVDGRQTSNKYRFMPLEELMGRGDYSPEGEVRRITPPKNLLKGTISKEKVKGAELAFSTRVF
jgi:pyocin large subunit-like protein